MKNKLIQILKTIIAIVVTICFLPIMILGFLCDLTIVAFKAGQETCGNFTDWVSKD